MKKREKSSHSRAVTNIAPMSRGDNIRASFNSADPYMYIFLGGVCEVPAYLLLWLLVARAGRRPALSSLYFFCALCIAVNASLMFAFPDGKENSQRKRKRRH